MPRLVYLFACLYISLLQKNLKQNRAQPFTACVNQTWQETPATTDKTQSPCRTPTCITSSRQLCDECLYLLLVQLLHVSQVSSHLLERLVPLTQQLNSSSVTRLKSSILSLKLGQTQHCVRCLQAQTATAHNEQGSVSPITL